MSKQELLIIAASVLVWGWTIKKPLIGISYFYLYYALLYNYLFTALRPFKILIITPTAAFFSLIAIHRNKLIIPAHIKWMIAFFICMCASRYFNGYDIFTGEEIDPYFKLIIFLVLLANTIDTRQKLIFFIWVMILSYSDLATVARYFDRLSAYYFLDRNNFAFSLVGTISIPIIFALHQKEWLRKGEAVAYFIILLYGIAGTDSRGGYMGLITVFLALFLLNLKKPKNFIILLIPIVLVLLNVSAIHWQRFGTIAGDHTGGTGGQRLALWATATRMMRAHPFLGVGSGESGPLFPEYGTFESQLRVGGHIGEESIKIHNMTLQLGAETGFIGLGIFLTIVILSLLNLHHARRICKSHPELVSAKYLVDALGVSIYGLLISGQFANFGYNYQLYTLLTLAFCMKHILLKEKGSGEHTAKTLETPIIVPPQYAVIGRALFLAFITYINLKE